MEDCYFLIKLQAEDWNVTKKLFSMGVFHVFWIVQVVPNRAKHQI